MDFFWRGRHHPNKSLRLSLVQPRYLRHGGVPLSFTNRRTEEHSFTIGAAFAFAFASASPAARAIVCRSFRSGNTRL